MNKKIMTGLMFEKYGFNEDARPKHILEAAVMRRQYSDVHTLLQMGLVSANTNVENVSLYLWAKKHQDQHLEALIAEFSNR